MRRTYVLRRMQERNVTEMDTAFKVIAEELPKAAKEMQAAEELLLQRNSAGALPPEQRALQHLQRREGGAHDIVRVGRADRLGQHVRDAGVAHAVELALGGDVEGGRVRDRAAQRELGQLQGPPGALGDPPGCGQRRRHPGL